MPLRGYKRLPGTSERYRTPSGEIISRRQYDNRRARRLGFKTYYQSQKERKSEDYQRWLQDALIERPELSRRDFYLEGEFGKRYAAARKAGFEKRKSGRDPHGPFAQFLQWLGLRESEWEWDVGDTPGEEGSK